jgi:nucleotide-binding universal stress UspA family protein
MSQSIRADSEARTQIAGSSHRQANARPTFSSVLVGVDGSSAGRDAIALGEQLRDVDGRLTLAHVVPAESPPYRNFHSTPVGKGAFEMLAGEAAAAGVSAEFAGMFARSVGSGLHQLAEDYDVGLLVVGSSLRGSVGRLLRGDDTQGSLSGAACAVAVAPLGYAEQPRRLDTIGVAYNGTPESETALAVARTLAAANGAAIKALTVVWPTAAAVWPASQAPPGSAGTAMTVEGSKREASERLRSLSGVDGSVAVGDPPDELVRFGDTVDLLVVGSRGHGPLRRLLLGSTSAHLAKSARCPVLVLPRPSR